MMGPEYTNLGDVLGIPRWCQVAMFAAASAALAVSLAVKAWRRRGQP